MAFIGLVYSLLFLVVQFGTTAGVTFETEPGSTHLVKDANGFTSVTDYGMLQTLGHRAQHIIARIPAKSVSKPPNGAHKQAITPKPVKALDITRAPSTGPYRSRTTARAAMTAAPMATPCKMRPAISQSIVGAKAHAVDATTYAPMPTSNTGLRP